MNSILLGSKDFFTILAFKMLNVTRKNKTYLILGVLVILSIIMLAANLGTGVQTLLTSSLLDSSTTQLIAQGINFFLDSNASIATSGIILTIIVSGLIIPMLGYVFPTIIIDEDIMSLRPNDTYKVASSFYLQTVTSISFLQLLAITLLASILTIATSTPLLGIMLGWELWLIGNAFLVLCGWLYELVLRRFGRKTKIVTNFFIILIMVTVYATYSDEILTLWGGAEHITFFIRTVADGNIGLFFMASSILAAIFIVLLLTISFIGKRTLGLYYILPEKRKISLLKHVPVDNVQNFILKILFRHGNIWKPILVAIGFIIGVTLVFYNTYPILPISSVILTVMLTLVWVINSFAILGSSLPWLTSLKGFKEGILGALLRTQYIIMLSVAGLLAAIVGLVYSPNIIDVLTFLMSIIANMIITTQFALSKSVKTPYKYRVYIRGDNILPPDKALLYLAQLFLLTGVSTLIMYTAQLTLLNNDNGNWWVVLSAQSGIIAVIAVIVRIQYRELKTQWLYNSDVIQNMVKTLSE